MNQLLQKCNRFICKHREDELCTIAYTKCTGCKIFQGFCDACIQTSCANCLMNKKKDVNTKTAENETLLKDVTPIAYVDGSFKNGVYGYGCVITRPDGKRHGLRGHDNNKAVAEMRNVAGEILGAMAAIRYAIDNNFPSLTIYYDYIGIEKWAKNEWKANKPATQAYKDFVNKCPIPLTFVKVKGHSGNEGNELADKLAKKAVGIA